MMRKRDDGTVGRRNRAESEAFHSFRYFRLFRHLSSVWMMTMKIDSATESSVMPGEVRNEKDLRRVAAEFESLLLQRFTSAINPSAEDEDSDLFRSDAAVMYRQMFAEQLAQTIAQSGGVGLAEIILRQMRTGEQATAIDKVKDVVRRLNHRVAEKVTAPDSHSGAAATRADIHHDEEVELQLPVSGRITSSFGTRRDPIDSRQRQHRGLDIAAPRGTPIEAAAEGRVVFAGDQRGYGRTVIIEHADGRRTRYAHADELQVSAGDCVAAGQIIATVGSTGRATGPHLHFEVIEEGRQIDPLKILAKDFPLTGR
jgi:murein DD-endopeptidase MepM/ murein hydrolase activator NlpD